MKTDIEIANSVELRPIENIAASLGIDPSELYRYGKYTAKVERKNGTKGKVILVTAINPTAAGEGKTTVSIGLADGMRAAGENVALALREPSLGPVFGMKGGATGGGMVQIAPMEDINLHFTGDLHAITAANNLLSAMIDNHIYWGNSLNIRSVEWRRCLDVNDRALRNIVSGLGYGCVREDGFDITAASEIMAVLCLAADENDLKERLGRIIIGKTQDGKAVTAKDIKAHEAMAILLKDALKPNLVQTLEGTPAFVHGGPFANIAHGCNSVIATRTAMHYADYVVTEAGFGADLGAEKFLDIKCRMSGIRPSAVVLVATVRALKCAGGRKKDFSERDDKALENGLPNLGKHIENITGVFGLPCVVAVNRFASDTDAEIEFIKNACGKYGVKAVCCSAHGEGGKGAKELAREAVVLCGKKSELRFAYGEDDAIDKKIEKLAVKIYGAAGVKFEPKAQKALEELTAAGYGKMPVCVAKTQYSLSDNAALIGRPEGFTVTVRDIKLRAGAGFLVALCGDILLMPGLGRVPNAENMSINKGVIKGLF